MKHVMIVGVGGQDGSLLASRATGERCAVLGLDREVVTRSGGRADDVSATAVDLTDGSQVLEVLRQFRPDRLYYLAAFHHSAEDKEVLEASRLLERSYQIHVLGLVNVLEGVRGAAAQCHVFYAASSHIFGQPESPVQDERTPVAPLCVYGITKAAGMQFCRLYRQSYGVAASVGILYNHESPARGPGFLSQKIVRAAVAMSRGAADVLRLGDLSARVDWGYAPDYVDAMWRITDAAAADDYVVATGEAHSVGDFVEAVFAAAGVDWRGRVVETAGIVTKQSVVRVGDSRKLRQATGWRPTTSFGEMARKLVEAERKRVARADLENR